MTGDCWRQHLLSAGEAMAKLRRREQCQAGLMAQLWLRERTSPL